MRRLRSAMEAISPLSSAALDVLSSEDILTVVFSKLGAQDLHSCCQVSHKFRAAAKQDILWTPLCEALWLNKLHVPARSDCALPRREAYCRSLHDSKDIEITKETLCGFPWEFRFKLSAGEYWTSSDPYWTGTNGGKPLLRMFMENGEYKPLTTPDPFWSAEGTFRWRMTKTRQGKPGHFVKVNNYPSLEITRCKDWGYVMENCWVVMNGPPRARQPAKTGT